MLGCFRDFFWPVKKCEFPTVMVGVLLLADITKVPRLPSCVSRITSLLMGINQKLIILQYLHISRPLLTGHELRNDCSPLLLEPDPLEIFSNAWFLPPMIISCILGRRIDFNFDCKVRKHLQAPLFDFSPLKASVLQHLSSVRVFPAQKSKLRRESICNAPLIVGHWPKS